MFTIELDNEVPAFLAAVTPTLDKEADVNSFVLSLAARTYDQGSRAVILLRGLENGRQLAIAGIQTERTRALILSNASEDVACRCARELSKTIQSLAGVKGPIPTVDAFAATWSQEKSCKSETTLNLRLFTLEKVNPPSAPAGNLRVATCSDQDLVVSWNEDFTLEALPHDRTTPEDRRRRVIDSIAKGHYFLWHVADTITCLVGSTRESKAGRWIGPVYTPKHLRGRGYGSALAAAVSQYFVDAGKRCLLFTDLSNPTSNSIYQRIGYRQLADFREIDFI